jgi:multiple sugar transport system substrate-binding protein
MAAAGAFATACGPGSVRLGTPPPSTAFSAPTAPPRPTLRQWYHAYGEDGVQAAVTRYAAAYPKAKVTVQWNPGDYDSKLATALQTGAVPDVFEAQVKIDWVRQHRVVPLDDLINPVKGDFNPTVLAAHTVEGKVYGIPQATDIQVLYFRKSLLRAAGVPAPQTVDELIDAAAKLTTDRVKGLFAGNDGGVGALTGPLLWSAGLDYLSSDNRSVGFDNPRAATAFSKLRTLNTSSSLLLGAPADWPDPAAFITGAVAMQWTGLSALPKIQAALPDDFGVLPFPKLDGGGTPSVPITAYGAMINAKSANVGAAMNFIKWLWIDRTENQLEFDTKFGLHVPVRASLLDRADILKSGPAADAARYVKENGHLVGGPMWTDQADAALSGAVTKIAKEGADPAMATRNAVDVVKAELTRLFG